MHSNKSRMAIGLCGLLLLTATSGCQYSYPFEILGIVRNADGEPLAGVRVTCKGLELGSRQAAFPVISRLDGKFRAKFEVSDTHFVYDRLPDWSLILTKDGYQDAAVDISPKVRPESATTTTTIATEVVLSAK